MCERIVTLYGQDVPTEQFADATGTCRSCTRRIRQHLRERGTLESKGPETGYGSGLTEDVGWRYHLGVAVDARTVGSWLKKLGLVLKRSRCGLPSKIGPA